MYTMANAAGGGALSKIDPDSFGMRLRGYRTERSMSLEELEHRTSVSKGYLSQLERGQRSNPGIDVVQKLAKGLDLNLSELIGESQTVASYSKMPRELQRYLEKEERSGRPVPGSDVEMLKGLRYQGRQPKSADDWALLYDLIKRVIR